MVSRLKRLGIEAFPEDPRLQRLLDEVEAREAQGYAYEAADASFELLARGILGDVPDFFDVESYQIGVERKIVAPGVTYSASQAVVKIRIGEERLISAAEGNGPVNALDLALRKDLGVYQKHIEDLELLDYRVRVFRGGADAVMRVLIEFGDGQGDTWSTVGASGNIIDASFQALVDTINYRLFKLGVPAEQGSRSPSAGPPKPRPGNGGADLAALRDVGRPYSVHMALISAGQRREGAEEEVHVSDAHVREIIDWGVVSLDPELAPRSGTVFGGG